MSSLENGEINDLNPHALAASANPNILSHSQAMKAHDKPKFEGAMTDSSVVGSMPHVGNWQFGGIADGATSFFDRTFKDSGFSHTAIGETLIGWASQSALPSNIGLASTAFEGTWDGSGFSNPTYSTGSAFGAEVSASYDYLVTTKGWTIPGFTFS